MGIEPLKQKIRPRGFWQSYRRNLKDGFGEADDERRIEYGRIGTRHVGDTGELWIFKKEQDLQWQKLPEKQSLSYLQLKLE